MARSATFSPTSGVYTFLSYRDPNLTEHAGAYDATADFLRGLELSDDELTRSIIGAIGAIDAYQLPDAKGYTSLTRYLTNETDERLQKPTATRYWDHDGRFPPAGRHVVERVKAAEGDVVVLGSSGGAGRRPTAERSWGWRSPK
jgi:hypothetical protein